MVHCLWKDASEDDSSVNRVDFELPYGFPTPSSANICSFEVLSIQIYHPAHLDCCHLTHQHNFFPCSFQLLAPSLNSMGDFSIHVDDLVNTLVSHLQKPTQLSHPFQGYTLNTLITHKRLHLRNMKIQYLTVHLPSYPFSSMC